jgi:hypothetical protein
MNETPTLRSIDKGTTRQLIEKQIADWQTLQESLRISMAVAEAIGDGEERKNAIRMDATRCVKALEKLQKMLRELDAPG